MLQTGDQLILELLMGLKSNQLHMLFASANTWTN